MKKTITSVIICLVAATGAHSQAITLSDTGLTVISNDSCALFKEFSAVTAVGQPLINGVWDISKAQYVYPYNGYYERLAPGVPNNFPAASYSNRGALQYGINYYDVNNYYAVNNSGISMLGKQGFKAQAFSRSYLTANSYDSLFLPDQTMVFSQPLPLLPFPSTMGSAWVGNVSYTTNMYVNSVVGSLSHVPMSMVTHVFIADTIVGWGRMRVRLADSTKMSDYVSVLQVRELSTQTDSFFINGVPAPDSIINYLGLFQGAKPTLYFTKFLRAGEIEPLLTTRFNFPYYGPAYSMCNLMHLPIAQPNGVKPVSAARLCVYPNPSATREIRVAWPGVLAAVLSYSITDFAGHQLALGKLELNKPIKLQQSLPAGIYNLTVFDGDGTRESISLLLQ